MKNKFLKFSVLTLGLLISSINLTQAETTYTNNLTDELSSYKVATISIKEDKTYNPGYLRLINMQIHSSERQFEFVSIFNPSSNARIGSCYGYETTCTLMFKFDNKDPIPFEFTSDLENELLSLEDSEKNLFIKNLKTSKTVKTKVNNLVMTFDTSNINYNKINF